ncbi:hypothetical protein [Flavobacterium stagni]|uniref:Uncharacterized protein n=1 Tax=Flavobacterium stagni TaxID=2506421 RepID=A0A4Q1KB51_9FLAO|nr:hypothetical protein [Flavobacterium stagni]RXR22984.1 hypothetical protein EQG61_07050 [Flavobacterium stagni]
MQKFLTRFALCYFVGTTAPWFWFELPPFTYLGSAVSWFFEQVTTFFNTHLWHVKSVLNRDGGGSGDTSYAWAEYFTIVLCSFLIAVVWGFFEKSSHENRMYWTRTLVRYFIAFNALSYGIIKIFGLQMPEPSLSRYATYFGDLLPMRLAWSFIGVSYPYEFFTGFIELVVGLLLLWRRTISLGVFIGLGVFLHVFMMNVCYDIPVKLFSFQLVIGCLYLIYLERHKFLGFFFYQKANTVESIYQPYFKSKLLRVGRLIFKSFFILYVIGGSVFLNLSWIEEDKAKANRPHFKEDIYKIETYIVNSDTISTKSFTKMDWNDFIFEKGGVGSIQSKDSSLFKHRYGRVYFDYILITKNKTVEFRKTAIDSVPVFVLNYEETKNTLILNGIINNKKVYWKLKNTHSHFPLQDKPFHWISEANR